MAYSYQKNRFRCHHYHHVKKLTLFPLKQSSKSSSHYWMVFQDLFWEFVIFHLVDVLKPIISVCTEFHLKIQF